MLMTMFLSSVFSCFSVVRGGKYGNQRVFFFGFLSINKASWIYGPKDIGQFLGIRGNLIKLVGSLCVCVCVSMQFYAIYGFIFEGYFCCI